MKMKTAALLLALVLVFGVAVGGTLAWLTAETDPVTNTFTTSDIAITLTEPVLDNAEEGAEPFQMIPGYTIAKDPTVTVLADSEKCYLFVKVEKSANYDSYMTHEMAEGWTALPDVAGVFYRVVDKSASDQSFAVLKDNQVSVKSTVTKADMTAAQTTQPTLTFTAYASQFNSSNTAEFTPAQAWAKAPKN